MRVPLSWLNAYCDSGLSALALADRLALTGTEVERVTRFGSPADQGFVIGKVLSTEQHPDADRLTVCQVDVGDESPATIVCGAPNVAAGQTVAVALPGAVMPDGTKLKKAKLRGVESNGMILAADELGIGVGHSGVMVLDEIATVDGLKPGAPLAQIAPTGDDVLELEITPNRPDCLGVYGVAREIHALTGALLTELPGDVESDGDEGFEISVEDFKMCPRFTARLFEDVKVGPSPLWLQQRLAASGQRPINNVVDITNYVMLLTSQPMHAFDRDKIRGQKLIIRQARDGEKMTTLDDIERVFDSETVLVCDDDGPSGIAGIMGGQVSEVSGQTTRVLLEIATWNGPNIHRTSQKLALRSEASGRFEKGLSPYLPLEVQQIASRLMVELCEARLVSKTIDVHGELSEPAPIRLRPERMLGLLGAEIPVDQAQEILERLGFDVEGGDILLATPPHFRMTDVTREADLIEEVARIYGMDKLPTTLPKARSAVGRLTRDQKLRRRVADICTARSFSEAITWSFTSDAMLAKLSPGGSQLWQPRRIANPLSEDQSVMRPLALVELLDAVRHNISHGRESVRLFELGRVYRESGEHNSLAAVISGPASERSWRGEAVDADFYTLRGLVESVFDAAGVEMGVEPVEVSYLHPARAASLIAAESRDAVGVIGELHPLVAQAYDIPGAVVFELNIDRLAELQPGVVHYKSISTFPSVREDIAVVVDESVGSAAVLSAVRAAAGEQLSSATIFDVYRGEQVGEGKVSMAIALEFAAPDRTLTTEEVAATRVQIEHGLAMLGGGLRA